MLASTAPSTSQMCSYFFVIPVLLNPGWSICTITPFGASSCASKTPPMFAADLLMWCP